MTTLNQIKPIFNFIKKNTRPILRHVLVDDTTVRLTDIDTYIVMHDTFGLAPGFHAIETIGLVGPTDAIPLEEYPAAPPSITATIRFEWSQQSISSFLPFTSNDETRLFLMGVAISRGHLVATNGHILKRQELGESLQDCNYIMPTSSLRLLVRLLKKYKINCDFIVYLDEDFILVSNSCFAFKARLIKREFPNWKAIVPDRFDHELVITDWIDIKELKPLFNKHYGVTLRAGSGVVVAIIKGHVEEYLVGVCDKELQASISFNARYITTCIEKEGTALLQFSSGIAPALLNNNVIMPLRS